MDVAITARSLNLSDGTLTDPQGVEQPAKVLTGFDLYSRGAVVIKIALEHWPEFLAYMNDPDGYIAQQQEQAGRAAARARIVQPGG